MAWGPAALPGWRPWSGPEGRTSCHPPYNLHQSPGALVRSLLPSGVLLP